MQGPGAGAWARILPSAPPATPDPRSLPADRSELTATASPLPFVPILHLLSCLRGISGCFRLLFDHRPKDRGAGRCAPGLAASIGAEKNPGARALMGHGAAGPQGGWGQYVAREPTVGIKSFCPPGKGDPAVPLEALAMPGEADDTQLNSRLPPAAASRTRLGSLGRISPYPHRGVGEVLVGTSAPQSASPPQNELRVDPQGLQGGVSEHAAPRGAPLPPDSPRPVPGGGHLPWTGEEHVCGRSLSQQLSTPLLTGAWKMDTRAVSSSPCRVPSRGRSPC